MSKKYAKRLLEITEESDKKEKEKIETPEDVKSLLPLDTLSLEVGYGLIPLVDEQQDGNLLVRIRSIRRQIALEMGVVIPSMHVRDNLNLKPNQYVVQIKGNPVATAEVLPDHYLAMDPGGAKKKIKGIATKEPAFNLPAMWITEEQKEEAILAGYTVVDPPTVIATHLSEIFKKTSPRIHWQTGDPGTIGYSGKACSKGSGRTCPRYIAPWYCTKSTSKSGIRRCVH